METSRLTSRIASVLHLHDAGDASIGGLEAVDAQATMDAIMDAGLTDDDSLRAFDVLHSVATFGRAW